MLVTTKEMLRAARDGSYAVGAFNAENMEMTVAVLAAAQELHAPVILQATPLMMQFASAALYAAMAKAAMESVTVPVALHLDHGDSYEAAVRALRAGYTSLMLDGSRLPYEENIALTRRVVELAAPCGIPVEAELGAVGGTEEGLTSEASGTDPEQAADFLARTGADFLAVGIGTAHGVYRAQPKLDLERLEAIRNRVDVPLVLHGASGLTREDIQACVARGICKINFATELRLAYSGGIKALLAEKPETFDPKELGRAAMARVKEAAMESIRRCGCAGKG
jgi:tagatose 1,6-diphosphate aldolase GatY/KbaY